MLALEGFTDLTETFTLPLISTVLEVALRVIFVGFFEAASLFMPVEAAIVRTTANESINREIFLIVAFITTFLLVFSLSSERFVST